MSWPGGCRTFHALFVSALLLCASCLPASANSTTPPTRFGVYETAPVLEPQEHQLSIGHAQPLVPRIEAPDTEVVRFIELDARVRKGLTDKMEGQAMLSSLVDLKIQTGRAALKYELPEMGNFRWAIEGGAALGYNGSRNIGASTSKSFFGGLDAGLLVSYPRHWKVAPYGMLGASVSATGLVLGLNADGEKDVRQSALIAPYATVGVDIAFSEARVLIEATPFLAGIPPDTIAPNVLLAANVSFPIGKKRYVSPNESKVVYSELCEEGKVELNGACYAPCPPKLDRCSAQQACVIIGASPQCRFGRAIPGAPASQATSTSAPSSASAPSSMTASAPATAPTSQPKDTRDDKTICFAEKDGLTNKERAAICQRFLDQNPDDPMSLLIEARILELQ